MYGLNMVQYLSGGRNHQLPSQYVRNSISIKLRLKMTSNTLYWLLYIFNIIRFARYILKTMYVKNIWKVMFYGGLELINFNLYLLFFLSTSQNNYRQFCILYFIFTFVIDKRITFYIYTDSSSIYCKITTIILMKYTYNDYRLFCGNVKTQLWHINCMTHIQCIFNKTYPLINSLQLLENTYHSQINALQ